MNDSLSTTDKSAGVSTVFFSYCREDQARALPIIRLIEQAGFSVWWDGLLEGGERFSRTTEEALERAQAVVVLWSKAAIHSHWVHDEATRGRDRRVLVPLSLDGSEPPLGFGQFQTIDISRARINLKDASMQRMMRAISAMHSEEAPRTPLPQNRQSIAIDRRTMVIGGSVLATAVGGVAAWQLGLFGGSGRAANRIAVLPFDNIGGDPKFAYLAEGLATEIRSTLSQNGALEIIGQASSEAFERGEQDAVSFAREVKAGLLVDGTIQVATDKIKATIELIDGKTGVSRPSRVFERAMGDVLAMQREIAGAISAELSTRIGEAGAAKNMIGGTSDVIAYDHYLRGKDLYAHARNEAEEREAVDQFDAAIAADPKFAAAHAGRARALSYVAGQYGSAAEIRMMQASAVASARRAAKLAPRLADAHSALALLLFQGDLDIKAAREPFDLSRQLGEGDAPVMARFALYCAATGRDSEAVSAIERAILLDPLNALIHRIAGTVHFAARRYPEAIAALREAVRFNPNLADSYNRIGMNLLAQNKNREALKEFETDTYKWSKLAGTAIAQKRLGNEAAANAAFDELVADTETVSLYQQGQVLAQWGRLDEAVATLQRGRVLRDAGLTAARYDTMLDPLRPLQQFRLLLSSLGFD